MDVGRLRCLVIALSYRPDRIVCDSDLLSVPLVDRREDGKHLRADDPQILSFVVARRLADAKYDGETGTESLPYLLGDGFVGIARRTPLAVAYDRIACAGAFCLESGERTREGAFRLRGDVLRSEGESRIFFGESMEKGRRRRDDRFDVFMLRGCF